GPDVTSARIETIGLFAGEVTAGYHPQPGFTPKPERYVLIAPVPRHVEPEEEPTIGTPIAVAAAENCVCRFEFADIEVAVSIDMAFVAVGDDRNLLRRQRHLRGRNVAEFEEASDEATVASGKTNSQPGQAGTFGQGLEYDDILEIRFCD